MLPPPSSSATRLDFLDVLRGLAALAVVFFHFTNMPVAHSGGPLASGFTWAAGYGFAAVYVFFVLSGFVLPWSMDRTGYQLNWGKWGQFMGKRLMRLWPPCAVILLGMVWCHHPPWGAFSMKGFLEIWPQLTYTSTILEKPRYLEFLWTLELEFQFYLAISLIYPWLVHPTPWRRRLCMAVCCLGPLGCHSTAWLPHFMGFFVWGMALFWLKSQRCGRGEFAFWVLAALAGSFQEFSYVNLSAGLLGLLFIILPLPAPRPLVWLGTISYSLYLAHFTARDMISLWLPQVMETPSGFVGLVCLQTCLAIGFAVLFHLLIERPSQIWASRLGRPRKLA